VGGSRCHADGRVHRARSHGPGCIRAPLVQATTDESLITRAIVVNGDVVGTIGSWGDPDEREVTYWIGRSYWGKGIATGALNAFLAVEQTRPLHAHVAYDNVASRRVLEKCGFRVIATERGFAEARSGEIEELVLRLAEEPASSE
jgi:RimJ/RimL family protein N-acetyltransferase